MTPLLRGPPFLTAQDEINALDPDQFYETDDEFDLRSPLSAANDRKILKRLTKIRDNARNCSREAKPEPSWGSEVFKPLLDFAVKLENVDAERKVQTEDMYVDFRYTWPAFLYDRLRPYPRSRLVSRIY